MNFFVLKLLSFLLVSLCLLHMLDAIVSWLSFGSHWPWASWAPSIRAWKWIHWIWVPTMRGQLWPSQMVLAHWPVLLHHHSLVWWQRMYVSIAQPHWRQFINVFLIFFFIFLVNTPRMAIGVLGHIRYIHGNNCSLFNLGIGWGSTMELSKTMSIIRIWSHRTH